MTFLLGLPGVLLALLKRGAAALGKLQPFQIVSLALVALSAFLFIQRNHARSDAVEWKGKFVAEKAVFAQTVKNFRAGQVEAKRLNEANIARIQSARATVNERTSHALNTNLGTLRDLAARGQLRPNIQADRNASSGSAPSPGVVAPCRANDPAWLCLSPGDVLRAAENEERHDRLIDAVEGQASIDPNAH